MLSLPSARDRFLARLRKAVESVSRERVQVELFFDYWVMGTRHPEVREKIQAALAGYREVFRPLIEEVRLEDPDFLPHGSVEALAGVAVSFVEGCAVQAIMEPDHFDVEHFMSAMEALFARPLAPA